MFKKDFEPWTFNSYNLEGDIFNTTIKRSTESMQAVSDYGYSWEIKSTNLIQANVKKYLCKQQASTQTNPEPAPSQQVVVPAGIQALVTRASKHRNKHANGFQGSN